MLSSLGSIFSRCTYTPTVVSVIAMFVFALCSIDTG
jgi:hypothetical protein